jgi:RimJ/RimL family protein N-acetyltransferase
MISYQGITFRPMEPADVELVRQMRNEQGTLLQMGDPWPISPGQQYEWFEAMSRRRSDVTFMVCLAENREPIGVWRLQKLDAVNRVCEVGVDVFPQFRRQGFGYKTYRMLLSYLFDHYNIHMVYLRTAEFNQASQSLYRKVGFKETGRLVQSIFRHGQYWDNIIMCLTRDEYKILYPECP